jgi:hypothetical protein
MERAAPTQLRYTDTVPLAIPSSSNRREFTSNNGHKFDPTGANVVRIDINSDNYLDTAHSYLEAKFTYKATDETKQDTFAPDIGPCFINRLSISSGGVLLEDITSYNKLYAFLQLAQSDKDRRQDSVYFNSNIGTKVSSLAVQKPAAAGKQYQLKTIAGVKVTASTDAEDRTGTWTCGGAKGTYTIAKDDETLTTLVGTTSGDGGTGFGGADGTGTELTAAQIQSFALNPPLAGTVATAAAIVAEEVAVDLAAAATALDWSGRVIDAPVYNNCAANGDALATNVMKDGDTYTYTIPLMSALFNASKYLPLVLVNAGISIELTLSPGYECGVAQSANSTAAAPVYSTVGYELSNIKYVAHLIDLDRSFNDVLKSQMMATGAITLHGHVWRHFQSTFGAGESDPNINIPVRMKSINSIHTLLRDQARTIKSKPKGGSGEVEFQTFITGCATQCGVISYNYKIGSVMYPQQPVVCGEKGKVANLTQNATACGPAYCELMKSFNSLGDTSATTALNRLTYGRTGRLNGLPGQWVKMFCMSYDVQSFSNVASVIESGIDSASRALPISIEIHREPQASGASEVFPNPLDPSIEMEQTEQATQIVADSYACSDGFFYFNPDGTVTPSV